MQQGRNAPNHDRPGEGRDSRARRLIAGLRVTRQDEALLAVVRPFFANTASEGEMAYQLWRYGLELTLAEAASLGVHLPSSTTELVLARLVARRLLLALPLLRRTGTLTVLGLDAAPPDPDVPRNVPVSVPPGSHDTIDERASEAVASLGGSDFL
jgi:hypothetical protein